MVPFPPRLPDKTKGLIDSSKNLVRWNCETLYDEKHSSEQTYKKSFQKKFSPISSRWEKKKEAEKNTIQIKVAAWMHSRLRNLKCWIFKTVFFEGFQFLLLPSSWWFFLPKILFPFAYSFRLFSQVNQPEQWIKRTKLIVPWIRYESRFFYVFSGWFFSLFSLLFFSTCNFFFATNCSWRRWGF